MYGTIADVEAGAPAARSVQAAVLCGRLYAAAQHHALRAQALAADASVEHAALDAATCAGAVVELLSKAVLAQRDLRLIAKGDAVHHHLLDVVVGAAVDRPSRPTNRSIDARMALALAGRLEPSLADQASSVQKVLEARNEAVHLAAAPGETALRALMAQMARFATAAAAALGHSAVEFWGDRAEAVKRGIAEQTKSVRERASDEVTAAKSAYDRLLGGLDDAARSQVISVLQSRTEHDDLDLEVECPACGHGAQVMWSAEFEAEWDHGEVLYHSYFVLTGLHCPVCGLRLGGEELESLEVDLPDPHDLAAEADFGDYADYAD